MQILCRAGQNQHTVLHEELRTLCLCEAICYATYELRLKKQLTTEHDWLWTSSIEVQGTSISNLPAYDVSTTCDCRYVAQIRGYCLRTVKCPVFFQEMFKNLTSGQNNKPNAPQLLLSSDIS
jgi:hypothetical protein